jgi:dihydropteroate synthase
MKTKLMAVLNVTPDSFYEGGRWQSAEAAIQQGILFTQQGADFLDIGGESSRPGSTRISEEEELKRVLPVIESLSRQVDIPLSIDTMKPGVAEAALQAGASFINDVSGFRDRAMQEIAAAASVPICVMHMHETPETMQLKPSYQEGLIPFLIKWFTDRIDQLIQAGVKEENIIIDPGIGFGKTVADNIEIIQNLHKMRTLGFPILIGSSRKSFLGKILNKPATELLASTLAVHILAIQAQVDIIRVHDVKEHRDVLSVLSRFL